MTMARNDPSALQIVLDTVKNIEAKLDRIEEKYDGKHNQSYSHAENAHKRIDKYENRFLGIVIGSSVGGGGVGAFVAKYFPAIFS